MMPPKREVKRRKRRMTPELAAAFLESHAAGDSLELAARKVGMERSTFTHARTGLVSRDPDFAEQLAAAKAAYLESKHRQVDEKVEEWAMDKDAAPIMRIFWAKRWNPAYREKHQLEVTGQDGGPITIEDRSASLADVARVLEAVGALAELSRGPARPALPPAARVIDAS